MPYEIKLIDLCFPDYFQGFPGLYFAVSITCNDTVFDVIEQLKSETEYSPLGDVLDSEIESALEKFKQKNLPRKDEIAFSIAPEKDEEPVYAYFGLIKTEED